MAQGQPSTSNGSYFILDIFPVDPSFPVSPSLLSVLFPPRLLNPSILTCLLFICLTLLRARPVSCLCVSQGKGCSFLKMRLHVVDAIFPRKHPGPAGDSLGRPLPQWWIVSHLLLLRHSVAELNFSAVNVALLEFYSILGVIRNTKEKWTAPLCSKC